MNQSTKVDQIRHYVGKFRDAILSCSRDDWPLMRSFPQGACGDASILLGEYLHEQGLGVWVYAGRERDSDLHSHAWLEQDGLIVDITADQFEDVNESIIVTCDRSWHQQFMYPEETHPALIDLYDERTRKNLRAVYANITATLESRSPGISF